MADTEYELKLLIEPDALDALIGGAAFAGVAWTERETVATYFDTPDQTLRAAHASLRIRVADKRRIQTVKAGGAVAVGLFARAEWEQEVEGDAPELGATAAIRTLVPATALDALAPAFTVAVTRRTWEVARGGATIELVADRGTVIAGDRSTPVCEIELELKDGPPAPLFALARELGQAAALRLGVLTKAERGYRLSAALERANKAEPIALAPGMTTADAFAGVVGACLRQFRLNEDLLRARPSPEALHQARVALRRLRSALSIFRAALGDDRAPALGGELRWLAGTLGEARDLDVLIGRLGLEEAAQLRGARDAAYAAALDALASQRARDLMIDLVEWTATGDWRGRDAALGPAEAFAAQLLDQLRRRVKRRGRRIAVIDDESRHRVRIQAKKLRYAAEFFAALFPGKAQARRRRRFLAALEVLQDQLGHLNDLATAPRLRARHGLPAEPEDARSRAALLDQADEAHGELVDAKRFWR